MTNQEAEERVLKRRSQMLEGGGADKIEGQHRKGKLTARERIALLLDEGSFVEHQPYITGRTTELGMDKNRYPGDGVISGYGKIDGRQIYMFAQDFTVLGGSLGEMHAERIAEVQMLSLKNGTPFIQINDSGGARIQEGVVSLNGYAKIFRGNTLASGVIPQFSLILGPCAGGAAYSPAITDFIFMVDSVSSMYITGPEVIKAVTGEDIDQDGLGGAGTHCMKSGNVHFRFSTEEECIEFLKRLLSYLPSNNMEKPPYSYNGDPGDRETPELAELLPENQKRPYDIKDFIASIFDRDSFLEVHADYAPNVVVGFARLKGHTVGIFANQPRYYAASLDINSSDKAARFIRFCDCFNVPIVSLADVPGFLPGVAQEHGGIIRHGAKILYAIAEATVPKLSLIIRKAYGGAFIAMSSKSLGYDRVLAMPTAEIAVMGAEGAANIIFRREIQAAANPEEARQEKIDLYKENVMTPYTAAALGYVDDVIEMKDARKELIRSLEMVLRKKEDRPFKKHGNIPL
ncbi:MAG: acyl-CoA carboxylase subunit beta [Spirochaetales bacterium]|nr:MAG: acyl-CoA carboxylase subunit beta [Spirochaetales bacterium]